MSEDSIGLVCGALAIGAILLSQATNISALLLYLGPIALVVGALFDYGAVVLYPLAALLVAIWWLH